jgi:hypothetical protein
VHGAGGQLRRQGAVVRELTDEEAKPFITLDFIDGLEWLRL